MTTADALRIAEKHGVFEAAARGDECLWADVADAILEAVAAEREACAKIAEDYEAVACRGWELSEIAAKIRERGQA